jgi:peptidyl-prolyl cis-trans isomerase A (cyclophilin A)/peptidyl-prolyl cis-trans isomerase B (cyclophilin B)
MIRTLMCLAALLLAVPAMPALAANPIVEIQTTAGTIRVELYTDKAPKTVENFLQYVNDGFYTGTIFHRVIRGFMIQGGGYDKNFKEKKTRAPIPNEAGNGLHNEPGTIAMARTSDPNSAMAQFFINVGSNTFLNFHDPSPEGIGYAVFGKVISGLDVVYRIATVPTSDAGPFPKDVPQIPIMIESIKVVQPAAAPDPAPAPAPGPAPAPAPAKQ